MAERIETPPTLQGDEKKQLQQVWSYLYQLAESINNNLQGIGSNELTDSERVILKDIIGAGEEQGLSEMETLKSLIIKTADFVQTSLTEYRMNLLGETVASGQFGRYVRHTGLDVAVTPTGITQNYSFEEVVQGLKEYSINAKNYIKTGLLRTVSSIPVYGVAIGKDVVTFSQDGTETYNDGNKVAELTADELSFWQNGAKVASYKGTELVFYTNNTARLKIDSNGVTILNGSTKLAELLSTALKFYHNGEIRTQTDANGIAFYKGTTKLAEMTNSALTFYHNNVKRMQTDANGLIFYKDTTKLAELLSTALKFYYNGTLRTQMDTDGVKFYDGSTLLAKITGSRISFYNNSTEIFYIENGKIYSAEDIEVDANKKLKIGNWQFKATGITGETTYNNMKLLMHIMFDNDNAKITYEQANVGETVSCKLIPGQNPYAGTPKTESIFSADVLSAGLVSATDIDYSNLHQQSSKDIKHDIQDLPEMGERLDRLRPVTFVYDEDEKEQQRMGLIYEETLDVMPEICTGNEAHKAINYVEMIPAMLKEIQGLRARVKALEEREGGN